MISHLKVLTKILKISLVHVHTLIETIECVTYKGYPLERYVMQSMSKMGNFYWQLHTIND